MYDIIVIGGGHAGSEAALAAARTNKKTLLVSGNLKMIASMPCNPSIGGPAKGTLVRELDALGGEMGKNADKTALQMKMLNSSKGPAVRALRAQSDKVLYPKEMLSTLQKEPNLTLVEAYVKKLIVENNKVIGVSLENGQDYFGSAVVITTGTYMAGAVLVGKTKTSSGPDKQKPSIGLSEQLRELGHKTYRLKTGTPPRIKRDSVDFSKMELSPGDGFIYQFSYEEGTLNKDQEEWPCYLIHTAKVTHDIIYEHLNESSMYSGIVEGVGPRYCPSIEDKLVRFSDKERHQLFIEPESQFIDEVYLQGFSTSMPHEIQEEMVHSLPGLENAVIAKYAYAIEYDAIDAMTLYPTLESKIIENLYFAGQVNGTSGYEEAAVQGFMAGLNASLKIDHKEPLILRRDEAYIGVLIDDLVTKGTKEPYRMLTSRAEFRLLLRHDNADIRLTKYGHDIGLISDARYHSFEEKLKNISEVKEILSTTTITPTKEVASYLESKNLPLPNARISLIEYLKRPEIGIDDLVIYAPFEKEYTKDVFEQVEIGVKYEGYIQKSLKEAEKLEKEEKILIPEDIKYSDVTNLALEARQKLDKVRPLSIGQASRISGVNPADIQMLLIYLKQKRNG
ncbi:MAG: tRNA uridine-5-carboxymethylaminomethyl(34) synthesis enzyme MnmG [Candidatus Izemoplasmatales bacterium]